MYISLLFLRCYLSSNSFPKSLPSGKKREFRFHPIKETVVEEPVDITPYLDQLDESLRDKVLQLQKGRWVPALGVCLVLGGWQTGGFGRVLVGVCGEVTEAAQEMPSTI